MVVKGGMNDREILPMARHFRGSPYILRFIDGRRRSNGWKMDEVVPSAKWSPHQRRDAAGTGRQLQRRDRNALALRRRRRRDRPDLQCIPAFCADCTRARLSTEGKLYTCLFATSGHDCALLREGRSDAEISTALAQLWRARGTAIRNCAPARPRSCAAAQ
jgi:cyclic pyranopterin phosphate synthase